MIGKSAIGAMGLICGGVVLLSATRAAAQGEPCSECGPGAHWVDGCAAGQDQVANQGAVIGIDTDLDCTVDTNLILAPCGAPDDLLLIDRSGPLDDSVNFAGLRATDLHLDVIDTEIVSMCLTGGGMTLVAGAGQGNGDVLAASLGAIAEQPTDNTTAESFFDVFFEVDLGGGNFAYNQAPVTVQVIKGSIVCVPPSADYVHPTGCVALFTSPTPGQGAQVANLVTAVHSVNPPPPPPSDIPAVSEWGLAILLLLGLAIGTSILRRQRRGELPT